MSAVCIFPFRSIIPKRLMIFSWYLVWGCIGGTKVCRAKEAFLFDLDPVTLKPKFPSALCPRRKKIFYWYLVWGCIRGQRCDCHAKDLCPCDLDYQNCIIIPFCSVSSKRMKIFHWYLVGGCIRGQRCVARNIRVDVTFDLETEIPFRSVSLNEWRFCYWYLAKWCHLLRLRVSTSLLH
jgi:hypothetical protein